MNTTAETPNIDQPRLWRLYMLVGSESLHVMLFHTADTSGLQLFTLEMNREIDDITRRLEEAVYANPWLVNDFGRVSVLCDAEEYTVIPPAIAAKTDVATGWMRCQGGAVEMLDYRVPASLTNFIMRTWPCATIEHRVAPMSRYFYSKSRVSSGNKMYVNVNTDRRIDVIVYGRSGLMMLNTFRFVDNADAIYYIMACRDLLHLDQLSDELIMSGDRTLRDALTDTLRTLLAGVMPAIFPATVYGSHDAAADAPFPLILMPLCE